MTYSEKLKDPRWQKKRLEILQRDNWACQMCFDTKSMLAVHHRYYRRGAEPWDYTDASLVTLCQECHEVESAELQDAKTALLEAVSHAGLYSADIFNLALVFAEFRGQFVAEEFDVLLFEMDKVLKATASPDWEAYRAAFYKRVERKQDGHGQS